VAIFAPFFRIQETSLTCYLTYHKFKIRDTITVTVQLKKDVGVAMKKETIFISPILMVAEMFVLQYSREAIHSPGNCCLFR